MLNTMTDMLKDMLITLQPDLVSQGIVVTGGGARCAFWSTVLASCSIAAEVSSIVAACLVVRSLRSFMPLRISPVDCFSDPEICLAPPTISVSFSLTRLVSSLRRAKAP